MANNKDFIVKNAVEVGGSTKVTVGDAAAGGSYTQGYDLSVAAYDSVSFSVASQATTPQTFNFKSDGTKLYVLNGTDVVYQYSLSTAYDLSTASYDSVSFSLTTQTTTATASTFSSDGTKLYIGEYSTDTILQYSLSTAWDLSTASYDSKTLNVSANAGNPNNLLMSSDGLTLWVTDGSTPYAYEYTLSTANDISTGSYANKSLNLSSTGSVNSFGFNSNGTILTITGASSTIYQYSLSTAYDISTATILATTFSVASQDVSPTDVIFNSNGTKMYVLGASNDTIYQYSTGSTVTTGSFDLSTGNYFTDTPSADVEYTFSNAGDVQSFQVEVTGAQVVNGFDLSVAAYDSKSFSVSSQDTAPTGIQLNDDGTKMFIVGDTGNDINEYTLSTAYDISTATYSQNFSVSSQTTNPHDIFFKPDGTKMFVVSSTNPDTVYQYGLTTGYDLSTASYDSKSKVVGGGIDAFGLFFSSDGTKMYIVQNQSDRIDQWSLSTAWDVSTATADSKNGSVSGQDTNPRAGAINSDGTKVFVLGVISDTVYQYSLSTAYDISTMSYDSVSFSVSSQETTPQGLSFKPDGTKMYIIGSGNDTVYQYTTGSSTAITITWDADIEWGGGTAPDSPAAGEKDLYTITTDDGGTTYFGVQSGDAFS